MNKLLSQTAVVLLNYNSLNYLKQFLPDLVKYTPTEVNLVIIDNNSSDQSKEYVSINYPEIKWLQLEENEGYAGGYHEGLKQIQEDYWFLLNTDIQVTENWIEPLLNRFSENDQLAAIQPKVKAFSNKEYFEHAGACGGFLDQLAYPYCRGRIFDTVEIDDGQYNTFTHCFWASGACMGIKKSAYNESGGFDSRYFMHMEEIDLCWRFNRMGYHVACEPSSTVYHVGGGGLDYKNPKKIYYNFRNSLICLQKNYPFYIWIPLLITRFFLDGFAIINELIKGKFKFALAIIHAYLDYFVGIFSWNSKFNLNQTGSTILGKPFSIVWHYFLLKQHKYSSLRHESTNRRS